MNLHQQPMTILCITCYFKGTQFLRTAKALGCYVILITAKKLEHKEWPRESIDEIYYVPQDSDNWNMDEVIRGIAYLFRSRKIDRVVALDDYDVEKAAHIREEFRIPGMGQTRARYFRDKLAMRMQAAEEGIQVPPFCPTFNHDELRNFTAATPAPWLLKPRSAASATGIKKIHDPNQLWAELEALGDRQHTYLLESFIPGEVYHVDSLIDGDKVIFARASRYMNPPMEVAHEGRVFRSYTLEFGSKDEKALLKLNKKVLRALGMKRGASHTEFIKSAADGKFYFLETSARVGGAHLVEMIEASSGINLWSEWAKIETRRKGERYELPTITQLYAGIILSLAKQEHPDTSAYNDPEIVWRLQMPHHAGLIVRSEKLARVVELLENYAQRFYQDFFVSLPPAEKPTH
ncbi:MAG: ATP-grasp domain-containing protein [Cytophagales bacterium]|nr:ATP-grasp domain-containing protein [Bernardetiaceae bacterium]MDW8209786.1 ATP-grasp domain-containing protein [Cytophagales bacterium]